MAGTAVTSKFMLGTATVMLGPMVDLPNLTPELHSIGLVKNFSLTFEPSSVDLTQGIRNSVVMSIVNGGDIRAQMEVYEYTSKNLSYGLGLDGSAVVAQTVASTVGTLVDGTPGPVTSIVLAGGGGTAFAANDQIMVIDSTNDDRVTVRKIVSKSVDTLTVAGISGYDIPVGAVVQKVNMIPAGNPTDGLFLGAKVVGVLADGAKCVLLFPKVRVVRGFTVGFQTNDYSNMPFEFKMLDLVSTDANYADFGANVRGQIFARA